MNDDKIGEEYDLIANFNLDKDKNMITFNGIRKGKIYLVTVTL